MKAYIPGRSTSSGK